MLTIGAFARLSGISVRGLRHYEHVGVLRPASVDPVTGYRRYHAAQLLQAQRIQALQDLGLSLQQIRSLLADGLGAEQLSALLQAKRDELAHRVAADRARLERVERRLRYLEMEDQMPMEFVIKEIPATRVAQVRHAGDQGLGFGDVEQFARTAGEVMRDAVQQSGVAVTGPGFLHYEERPDGTVTPFLALPIGPSEAVDHSGVATADLPAITAVTAVYRGAGGHDLIGPLYGQMARYAADHGYDVYGPGRDVFVGHGDDGLVLELQLPVRRPE